MNGVRCIALGPAGIVHVVWYDRRTGTDQIFYKRSTDNGFSWSNDTQLTTATGVKENPAIAANESTLHLVWQDHRFGYNAEVFYKRSTDGGITWSDDIQLTNDNFYSRNPCVAAQDSFVHIAWSDDTVGREIYYRRSTDWGLTWQPRQRLTFDIQESWYPSIAVSGPYVHLVWRDWRDHSFEVYYKRSTDYGITWSEDVRLSEDPNGSYNPCIAVSNQYVHVIWWETRHTPFEIYYQRSTNNGATWGNETRLTNDTTGSYNPTLVAAEANVHVFWEALYGTSFIMYKHSTDYGSTWSTDTALTVQPEYWSVSPSSASNDSAVHIVWTDFRDNEYGEIYYKQNLTANVGIKEHSNNTFSNYKPKPTIVRNTLFLPTASSYEYSASSILFDIMGRKVMKLKPGFNDIHNLAPGVYLLCSSENRKTSKIIIQR